MVLLKNAFKSEEFCCGVKMPFLLSGIKDLFLVKPNTSAHDIPKTPASIVKIKHCYNCSFDFSSIFFAVFKIKRIKTAHKEAAIPIKATTLSP